MTVAHWKRTMENGLLFVCINKWCCVQTTITNKTWFSISFLYPILYSILMEPNIASGYALWLECKQGLQQVCPSYKVLYVFPCTDGSQINHLRLSPTKWIKNNTHCYKAASREVNKVQIQKTICRLKSLMNKPHASVARNNSMRCHEKETMIGIRFQSEPNLFSHWIVGLYIITSFSFRRVKSSVVK